MNENRQPIRRNLTGGLSLGFFAGFLLCIPDIILSIKAETAIPILIDIAIFHISFGILSGGLAGIVAGIMSSIIGKFGNSSKSKTKLWAYFFIITSFFFLSYPVSRIFDSYMIQLGATFGLILFIAAISTPVVNFYKRIYSGYTSNLTNYFIAFLLCIAGLSGMWGGIKANLPGLYLESFASVIYLLAFLILFISYRKSLRKRSKTKRGLAFLASPRPVVLFLVLGTLGGTVSLNKIKQIKSADNLHKSIPVIASIALTKQTQSKEITNTHSMNESKNSVQKIQNRIKFQFPKDSNIIIITQDKGEPTIIKNALTCDNVVLPHYDNRIIMGSFLTGMHLGMRLYLNPDSVTTGPVFTDILRKNSNFNFYNFSKYAQSAEYFREIPNFGFPAPYKFVTKKKITLNNIVELLPDLKPNFLIWFHLSGHTPPEEFSKLYQSLNNKSKADYPLYIVYLSWQKDKITPLELQIPKALLQIAGKGIDTKKEHQNIALPSVLPSLFSLGSKYFDQGGRYFPAYNRKSIYFNGKSMLTLENKKVKTITSSALKSRIRHRTVNSNKRPNILTKSIQNQIISLNYLLCKKDISQKDLKRVEILYSRKLLHPQIKKRCEILLSTKGKIPTPKWISALINYQFFQLFALNDSTPKIVEEIKKDKELFWWTLYYFGNEIGKTNLRQICPAVEFR